MKLIVGLGNPGRIYVNSRHNLGFRCVNFIAQQYGISLDSRRGKARIGIGKIANEEVILAKPRTFMNHSGDSVVQLVRFAEISLSDLLIIYDDLDFPLGTLRIREKGGAGGHNGMRSIIWRLGSEDFPRIRVGVGPVQANGVPDSGKVTKTPAYVLGRFSSEEMAIVNDVCPRVAEAAHCILADGISAAMNLYNARGGAME